MITKDRPTSFVCGHCASAPISRDGVGSHLSCPGAGEAGAFRGCDCARNGHQRNEIVFEYQLKYCHLDEDDLEFHWETGKTVQPSGDSVPVGADTVRRRRLGTTKTAGQSPVPMSFSAVGDIPPETKSKGSAREAERALAAFTGHGPVGKL